MGVRRDSYGTQGQLPGGGFVPGGAAGGDLSGFYPNPVVNQARGGVVQWAAGSSTVVATTGVMRVANDFSIFFPNAGNRNFIGLLAGPTIQVGDTAGVAVVTLLANETLIYCPVDIYADTIDVYIRGVDHVGGWIFHANTTGSRYLEIYNSSAPSTPTVGPRVFAEAGAFKCVGTGGTITTMAPA